MAKTEEERKEYNREKMAKSRAKKFAAMTDEERVADRDAKRIKHKAWRDKKKEVVEDAVQTIKNPLFDPPAGWLPP